MSTKIVDLSQRLPTGEEVESASSALTAIQNAKNDDGTLEIGAVRLSQALTQHVEALFSIIARGDTVTFMPLNRMLTTQQAADLLNVSRTHLIDLVGKGLINVEMVGTHRRVRFEELMRFKERRSGERRAALIEMQRLGEEYEAN